MMQYNRLFLFLSGLFCAFGVAAYAAAAHIGGFYASIAPILFGNGVALLFFSYHSHEKRIFNISGIVLVIGVLLFAVDVFIKQTTLHHLFPFAAPSGGIIQIIAWLMIACASFTKNNNSKIDS